MINQIKSGLLSAKASLAFHFPRGLRRGGSALFIQAAWLHECPKVHMEPTSCLLDCASNNNGSGRHGKRPFALGSSVYLSPSSLSFGLSSSGKAYAARGLKRSYRAVARLPIERGSVDRCPRTARRASCKRATVRSTPRTGDVGRLCRNAAWPPSIRRDIKVPRRPIYELPAPPAVTPEAVTTVAVAEAAEPITVAVSPAGSPVAAERTADQPDGFYAGGGVVSRKGRHRGDAHRTGRCRIHGAECNDGRKAKRSKGFSSAILEIRQVSIGHPTFRDRRGSSGPSKPLSLLI